MKNLGLLLSCATLSALPSSLAAQTAPDAPPAELNLETSQNATINLIRLLVEQGVIPRDAAVELVRQAEAEARQARAQTAAVTAAAQEIRAAAAAELALSDDDVRVTYVPEAVRQEIAADVRNELAAEARAARSSDAVLTRDELPSWVSRLRPYGDLRVRYSMSSFDNGNAAITDYNSVNTGAPYDEKNLLNTPLPTVNSDRDRDFFNLRARLGLEVDLSDGFTLGFRLATGNNASPVSTNQTVGSPGSFQKYDVWIDQAFLRYESSSEDSEFAMRGSAGRFPNPFFKSEITWDDDIQLDGFAFHGSHQTTDSVKTFLTAGLFPVFNTSFNFPSNRADTKFESTDRYLTAVQIGADTELSKNIRLKTSLAYYYFADIEGEFSTPYTPLSASDAGDTDGRRPTFAQKGNTYMPLRSIVANADNSNGNINQWQYYGLASKFSPLVFTAQLDLDHYEPFRVSFFTEVVKNLGFDEARVNDFMVNNFEATGGGGLRHYGGDLGWIVGVNVGQAVLQERGDWRVGLSYRYVESDSFVDGFVDSDFGGGGTNLQGITFGGQFALSPRVFLGARWLSASEVDGPAFRNDLFQFDINSKF